MKIAILGPVFTKTYFGGVATFDENLALGFKQLGHDVTLVSNQKDKLNSINGVKVITTREARKNNYDLMIASLTYCKFFPKLSARKKIYFLHGFYSFSVYGIIKTVLSVFFQRFYIKYCDYVISNSAYTHNINNCMLNVRSDNYVKLGVSYSFLEALRKDRTTRNNKHLLYIGRIVKAKNIDRIILALDYLGKENFTLDVVGAGCDEGEIKKLAKERGVNVVFHGRVQQVDLPKYYKKADIFVSLNPSEPFGITFLEALISGCKIICPKTGGQIDFLQDYPDRVMMVDEKNPKHIAACIKALSKRKLLGSIEVDDWNFAKVAKSIMNVAGGEK